MQQVAFEISPSNEILKYNDPLFYQNYGIEPLAKRVECSPMVWKTGVQSQVESYQRLKNAT